MRKNKNAFTLIELLAVIVILAIIALIATPIILGIVEDAKKDAFLRSVELVISTTDIDIANKTFEEEYTYEITDGTISNLEVSIKNTEGMNGTITYDVNGKEEYAIHNGVYCVVKIDKNVEVSDYKEGKCIIPPVLTEIDVSFITFNDLEYVYDGMEKQIEVNNLSDEFTVTYVNNKGTNVGRYSATAIITGKNHRGSISKEATLTIEKASITLKAEDKTSGQGEELEELTYQVVSGTIYGNDELNINLTKEDGTEIGTYNIFVNAENTNYEIILVNGIYTITVGYTSDKCFAFSNGTITGYYDYEENNSNNKECPSDVIIPNIINGVSVSKIGNSAFKRFWSTDGNKITSVKIPSSVTSIGDGAFDHNSISGELDLRHLTVLTSIGTAAFRSNQINSIKLPNSIQYIRINAFGGNKLSGELDLSNTKITSIEDSAFAGKSDGSTNQIISIKFPSSIESIGKNAFQYNKLSGELDLNNTKITSIGEYAFEGHSNGNSNQITNVNFPSTLESIGKSAFQYNKLSGELDLSNTKITSIEREVFHGTANGSTNQITSIKFPNSLTSIDTSAFACNAFSGELDLSMYFNLTSIAGFDDNKITSIKIPDGLESIGFYAFQGNTISGELDLEKYKNLTSVSGFGGNEITSVKFPNSLESIGNYAFQYNKINGELDLSMYTNLTSIGDYAFFDDYNDDTNQITSVRFPNALENIGNRAFEYNAIGGLLDLSNLTNLTSISGFGNNEITNVKFPSSVTSIGSQAFEDNKLSGELDLSIYPNLTSIGDYAFEGHYDGSTNQITNVEFPTTLESIGSSAFGNNKISGELDLSHLVNLTSVSGYGGNEITSIKLPTSVTTIGNYAFKSNKLSGELDLSIYPNLTSIGEYAFEGYGSTNQITSLKFPSSIAKIKYDAFRYNALTSVTFYGRSDLTGVTVGSNAWGWASGYNADNNIYFVNE